MSTHNIRILGEIRKMSVEKKRLVWCYVVVWTCSHFRDSVVRSQDVSIVRVNMLTSHNAKL